MTGFEFQRNGNSVTLSMRSDNPESKNWSNLEWFQWIKKWMETMIKLNSCIKKNFYLNKIDIEILLKSMETEAEEYYGTTCDPKEDINFVNLRKKLKEALK